MPHLRNPRTISLIRWLRIMRIPHRKRKMPRQRQPDLIRSEYFRALKPVIQKARDIFGHVRSEILRLYEEDMVELERARERQDVSRKGSIKNLVESAANAAAAAFEPIEVEQAARRYGERTNDFNKEQLGRQVGAAMGVSLSAIEGPIVAQLSGFATENVALIRTVPERYFERIRESVNEAYETGLTARDFAARLQEIDDISDNDAMRIARDQIGKLNAELNQTRQESLGVEKYIWRTAQDNRVRDEHAELEGEEFSWDDPPNAGTDGEPAHPGEAIQCRCFAEPILDEILGEVEEP